MRIPSSWAVGLAASAWTLGCTGQRYRISAEDHQRAVASAASDPDLPVMVVRGTLQPVRLRAADIERGNVVSDLDADPLTLEYVDARDAVAGVGYGMAGLGVVFLPISLVYSLRDEPIAIAEPSAVVSSVLLGAGLVMVLCGTLLPSPFPRAVPERPDP